MNSFSLQDIPYAKLVKDLDSQSRRDLERLLTPCDDLRLTVQTQGETAPTAHAHDFWEVFVAFGERRAVTTEISIIPPGLKHMSQCKDVQQEVTAFNISQGSLHFAGISSVFTELQDFRFLQPILLHLTQLYKYATTLGEAAQPWLDAHAPLLLRELVALFMEMHHQNMRVYTMGRTSPSASLICMAEHFTEPMTSLADMAAMLGLHNASMARLVRREVGRGAKHYQIIRRLHYACDLLAAGRISIGEVSRTVGWRNAHYFSTVFRKFTGMTPREFAHRRRTGLLNGYPPSLPDDSPAGEN